MKFKELSDEIDKLNITRKEKVTCGILGFVISALVFMGPICALINLLIFIDYVKLLMLGIFLCVGLIFSLTTIIYYVGIAKGRIKGLYKHYLPYCCFYMILVLIFYLIELLMGVF